MPNLAGLHDIESTAIAAPATWILDTVAIGERPPPKHYPSGLQCIARLNNGYGSAGTLPIPAHYPAFAQRVAQYVNGSSGCHRWIIGNEPNLIREWPDATPIFPWNYAACFKLCRDAIHALPGHERDEVLVAGSGPWNDELKYAGNEKGDWITYFSDVLGLIGDACDGFAIHAYTHGYDVSLVTSTARMNAPFANRYYEFRTYQDYLRAIPPALAHLPAYITEANGNGPWQATGLMPAMLQEIDTWNHSGTQKIHCVIFYRYPHYDAFYIEGRGDVIAEYRAAVNLGLESPSAPLLPTPTPPQPEPPIAPPEPISWDRRLTARGCTLQHALMPSDVAPLVKIGRWFNEQEAQGRVNIYIRLLDEQGKLAIGVPITQFWPDGKETKLSERKSDPWLSNVGLGAEYSLDFAMYNLAPSYGIRIEGDYRGDVIDGCGLGSIEQPDYKIHTAYFFEWQLSSEGVTAPIPPIPLPGEGLVHPLPGAVITQRFGESPENYKQFGQIGHNGCDLGNRPENTPVRCIADGEVAYVGFDERGYGFYCRVKHPQLAVYSFYAHLAVSASVTIGQRIQAGETIGLLGTTGNSSGVHLHLEIREMNPDGSYAEGQYGYTQGRVDPETVFHVLGGKL
jgi:murein DD-endopeptidase MepM/ murein hydrolase activator NlpD